MNPETVCVRVCVIAGVQSCRQSVSLSANRSPELSFHFRRCVSVRAGGRARGGGGGGRKREREETEGRKNGRDRKRKRGVRERGDRKGIKRGVRERNG